MEKGGRCRPPFLVSKFLSLGLRPGREHSLSRSFSRSFSSSLMSRAGTPPTRLLSGTSFVTTAPAAMTTLLPMLTPGRMVHPPPVQTSLPMVMGMALARRALRSCRPRLPGLRSSTRGRRPASPVRSCVPSLIRGPEKALMREGGDKDGVRKAADGQRPEDAPPYSFTSLRPGRRGFESRISRDSTMWSVACLYFWKWAEAMWLS